MSCPSPVESFSPFLQCVRLPLRRSPILASASEAPLTVCSVVLRISGTEVLIVYRRHPSFLPPTTSTLSLLSLIAPRRRGPHVSFRLCLCPYRVNDPRRTSGERRRGTAGTGTPSGRSLPLSSYSPGGSGLLDDGKVPALDRPNPLLILPVKGPPGRKTFTVFWEECDWWDSGT